MLRFKKGRLVSLKSRPCLLYTSDAADEEDSVDLGGRRIIKINKNRINLRNHEFVRKNQILSEVCMIKKGPHSIVYLRRDEKKDV